MERKGRKEGILLWTCKSRNPGEKEKSSDATPSSAHFEAWENSGANVHMTEEKDKLQGWPGESITMLLGKEIPEMLIFIPPHPFLWSYISVPSEFQIDLYSSDCTLC